MGGVIPQTALESAVSALAPQLPAQADGPATGVTERGSRYREIVSWTGTRAGGHLTPEAAIAEWRQRFLDYVMPRQGAALIWRERPQIGTLMRGAKTYWRVYSRFALE